MKFKKRLKKQLQINNQNNVNYEELLNKINSKYQDSNIINEYNKNKSMGFKQVLKYSLSVCTVFLLVFGSIYFTKKYVDKKNNEKIENLYNIIEELKDKNESFNGKEDLGEDINKPSGGSSEDSYNKNNEQTILQLKDKITTLEGKLNGYIEENVKLKEEYEVLLGTINNNKNSLEKLEKENDSLTLQNQFLLNELQKDNNDNFDSEGDNDEPSYGNSNTEKPTYLFSTGFTVDNLIEISFKTESIPFICNKIELNNEDYLLVYSSIVLKDNVKYLKFYHKLISKSNSSYMVEYKYLDQIVTIEATNSTELLNDNIQYLTIIKDEFTEKLQITVYNDETNVVKEYTNSNF